MSRIFFLFILFILSNTLLSQTNELRFAWLSDLHIGSSLADDDLSRSVKDINSMSEIDFVIISGDITESGIKRDFEKTKIILDSLYKPYYIIPGNHDTKWSESGCYFFSKIFKNDRFIFSEKGYTFIGLHQGPVMRMGDGHFSPEDLRWFDFEIKKINNEPIIFVTHYPMDSTITNWYEILDRLKTKNIKTILVGHGHSNSILDFEGVQGYMSRSNLRGRSKAGGYNIVHIFKDSIHISERNPVSASEKKWVNQSFNKNSNDIKYPRPDYSGNKLYPNIEKAWDYESGYLIASKPAIWKDMVYIGNSSGEFFALTKKSGKKIWSFKAEGAIYASPAVDRNQVVFASTGGLIYCLNAQNGKMKWKIQTGYPIVASPVIIGNKVYIGSSEGIFRRINITKGLVEWEYKDVQGFIETTPAVYKNIVIFGAWDGCLYALNIEDGSLKWKWSGDRKWNFLAPAACIPVVSDDKIFVVAPDKFTTSIDINTGKNIWRTKEFKVREAIGISEDGSKIFARTTQDSVFALSSKEDSVKVLWAADCKYGYDIDPSIPYEKDGTIFFGTQKGYVIALNSPNGNLRWKYRTGVALINNVTPLSAREVIITDMDGKIILLREH